VKITDKMRLDFVRRCGVGKMEGNASGGFFWPDQDCTRFGGDTFRAAIDAAIRSEKRGRKA
jgi:hypothetical protein